MIQKVPRRRPGRRASFPRRFAAVLAAALGFAASARPDADPAADLLYYEAWYAHRCRGRIEPAAEAYARVLADEAAAGPVAPRARLGLAECWIALKKQPQAKELLQRLVGEERVPEDVLRRARAALGPLETPPDAAAGTPSGDFRSHLEIRDVPFRNALSAVLSECRRSVVVDASVTDRPRPAVTLNAIGSSGDEVLSLFCRVCGLLTVEAFGAVYLLDSESEAEFKAWAIRRRRAHDAWHAAPTAGPGSLAEALQRPLTLDFTDAPVPEVVRRFEQAAGLPCTLGSGAACDEARESTLSVHLLDVPLEDCLEIVCRQLGLEPSASGGSIRLNGARPNPPPTNVTGQDPAPSPKEPEPAPDPGPQAE